MYSVSADDSGTNLRRHVAGAPRVRTFRVLPGRNERRLLASKRSTEFRAAATQSRETRYKRPAVDRVTPALKCAHKFE